MPKVFFIVEALHSMSVPCSIWLSRSVKSQKYANDQVPWQVGLIALLKIDLAIIYVPIDLNWLGISSSLQYSVCIARNSCCVSSSVGMLYIHVVDKRYSPLWPMETPDPDHSLQFQFKQKSVLTIKTCLV